MIIKFKIGNQCKTRQVQQCEKENTRLSVFIDHIFQTPEILQHQYKKFCKKYYLVHNDLHTETPRQLVQKI